MTDIIHNLYRRAQKNKKRILFPETPDPRILEAIKLIQKGGEVIPVALRADAGLPVDAEVFYDHPDKNLWLNRVYEHVQKKRGLERAKVEQFLSNPLLLSCYLLAVGYVDGGVAGSIATTANVLKAGFKSLGVKDGTKTISSMFLMALQDGRVLSYGDCAVVPSPTAAQLADIAIFTSETHQRLTGETPNVAMLSFSTKGSANHADVNKITEAMALVSQKAPHLNIDGELQFDAAINPKIGIRKARDSAVAGKANVFIFPDLDAGNIGYKITQELGGARAIGPILGGFSKPWMDLSRGCGVQDIIDVAVVSALLGDTTS
jgi:phosphate acetyltransferase